VTNLPHYRLPRREHHDNRKTAALRGAAEAAASERGFPLGSRDWDADVAAELHRLALRDFDPEIWLALDAPEISYITNTPTAALDPFPPPYSYADPSMLPTLSTYAAGVPGVAPARQTAAQSSGWQVDGPLTSVRATYTLPTPLPPDSPSWLLCYAQVGLTVDATPRPSRPMFATTTHARAINDPADADPALYTPHLKMQSQYWRFAAPASTAPFYHQTLTRFISAVFAAKHWRTPAVPARAVAITLAPRPMWGHAHNNATDITTTADFTPSAYLLFPRAERHAQPLIRRPALPYPLSLAWWDTFTGTFTAVPATPAADPPASAGRATPVDHDPSDPPHIFRVAHAAERWLTHQPTTARPTYTATAWRPAAAGVVAVNTPTEPLQPGDPTTELSHLNYYGALATSLDIPTADPLYDPVRAAVWAEPFARGAAIDPAGVAWLAGLSVARITTLSTAVSDILPTTSFLWLRQPQPDGTDTFAAIPWDTDIPTTILAGADAAATWCAADGDSIYLLAYDTTIALNPDTGMPAPAYVSAQAWPDGTLRTLPPLFIDAATPLAISRYHR